MKTRKRNYCTNWVQGVGRTGVLPGNGSGKLGTTKYQGVNKDSYRDPSSYSYLSTGDSSEKLSHSLNSEYPP